MRRSAVILLFLSAFAPVLMAQSRELPIEADAIKGDILHTDVWDFSLQWMRNDRGRATICNYGDTLLAETLDGRRFWYSCSGDSVLYRGEEDRLTAINLTDPAFVHIRPLSAGFTNGGVTFTARGTGGGKKFDISETGSLEFVGSARKGRLILAPGDTIANVLAVRERRYATASFPTDSAAQQTLIMTETYRWYDSDGLTSLIPLAIQRSTYCPYSPTDSVALTSTAYLPERGDISVSDSEDYKAQNDIPDINIINDALQRAEILCDGRTVTVTTNMPQAGLTVTVDIVDAAGRLYLHDSAISSGSADEISLDCSSLRTGEYIAAVGVENIPANPKKQLIIIR